jgi:hypothetical protein
LINPIPEDGKVGRLQASMNLALERRKRISKRGDP